MAAASQLSGAWESIQEDPLQRTAFHRLKYFSSLPCVSSPPALTSRRCEPGWPGRHPSEQDQNEQNVRLRRQTSVVCLN